jgi:hypothetical protein
VSAPRRGMRQHRTRHLDLARGTRDSVVSVAGLVRRPVRNLGGEVVGHVSDVVARGDTGEPHPRWPGWWFGWGRVGRSSRSIGWPRCGQTG